MNSHYEFESDGQLSGELRQNLQGALSHNLLTFSLIYRAVHALVDSGAEKSCISEEFLKRLRMKPEPLSPDESTCLYSANKSEIRKRGTVELNEPIQGLVMPFRFYVLQGLSYNCILGIDFLRDAQATIDCNQHLLSLYQGLVVSRLFITWTGNRFCVWLIL